MSPKDGRALSPTAMGSLVMQRIGCLRIATRYRKLIKYPELCKLVIELIKDGWTPEQIGNRMIQERAKLRVSRFNVILKIRNRRTKPIIDLSPVGASAYAQAMPLDVPRDLRPNTPVFR